jgi:hypothetical protein
MTSFDLATGDAIYHTTVRYWASHTVVWVEYRHVLYANPEDPT